LDRGEGYIAMNVSPGTLMTPQCADLLSQLPVDRVLLELSEHEPVQDYDALAEALAPFRAAGLRLAIDDVGAGFSSLRHIVVSAPDVLKIDRSLVSGVAADPVRTVLIRSLVDFARGLGAQVVAEGVETAEDAAALRALGVDYGQGWYFGRPAVPAPSPALVAEPAAAGSVPRPRNGRDGVERVARA
jgi:EAL domain-containing protein (putative c-di-GMP-specific phosphodiesterase class I)